MELPDEAAEVVVRNPQTKFGVARQYTFTRPWSAIRACPLAIHSSLKSDICPHMSSLVTPATEQGYA